MLPPSNVWRALLCCRPQLKEGVIQLAGCELSTPQARVIRPVVVLCIHRSLISCKRKVLDEGSEMYPFMGLCKQSLCTVEIGEEGKTILWKSLKILTGECSVISTGQYALYQRLFMKSEVTKKWELYTLWVPGARARSCGKKKHRKATHPCLQSLKSSLNSH